jgi:hypothetical protein
VRDIDDAVAPGGLGGVAGALVLGSSTESSRYPLHHSTAAIPRLYAEALRSTSPVNLLCLDFGLNLAWVMRYARLQVDKMQRRGSEYREVLINIEFLTTDICITASYQIITSCVSSSRSVPKSFTVDHLMRCASSRFTHSFTIMPLMRGRAALRGMND